MRFIALIAGFVFGIVPGFFIIGPVLFSDGPSDLWAGERLVTYALVAGTYAALGCGAGFAAPALTRWTVAGLFAPAAAFDILLAIAERPSPASAVMYFLYLSLVVGSSIAGGREGAALRQRRRFTP